MQNRPARLVLSLIILLSVSASGQKLVNSPYSRFNLGTIEPAASFRSLGMGGTGIAYRDNNSLYFANPASYSSLDTTSFIFDFGIDYGQNILSNGSERYNSDDFNFDHLLLGFPLARGWGFGAGIINLTNGHYSISQTVSEGDLDYDPIAGEYTANHYGSGGFTSFFMGSGLNVTKNFSIGANLTVLFGNVQRSNDFDFADYYNMFHYSSSEKLRLSGVNYDIGAQYNARLGEKYFLVTGVSYTTGKNYKMNYESISYRYTAYGNEDTLAYTSDNINKAYIPGTLKAGISVGRKDKFVAGLDYQETKWTSADIPGTDGYLGDTRNLMFGAEFIPDKLANYGFLRRLEYRAGFHTGDNYLVLNGGQIKENGISLGIGIPLRRSFSKANFYFDLTKKSAPGTVLHNETYFTFGASLNFYDYWFIKPKYN